ncbi:MAG: alpha/beta hydrolase [Candidatus Zixiibacteriota bacterium]
MILTVLVAAAGVYLLLCLLVYLFQDRLIFLPSRDIEITPDQMGWRYEDIRIPVATTEYIHAWYFPADSNDITAKTVLIAHGNAGNVSHRLGTARLFLDIGANVLLFDYRGYGCSDGQPSEANVYADIRAAYEWLLETKQLPAQNIFLFGRSLGGAAAVELALQVECGGVILESTFTSVADIGQKLYPFLPIRLLTRTGFDSIAKIGRLNCPVLVAHSPVDELIPYQMGRALFEAAREPKLFFEMQGGHNELASMDNELYRKTLSGFLAGNPALYTRPAERNLPGGSQTD